MNDITVYNSNLPSRLDELSKFVLIGREKLVSVRAEIRAIEKVGLAQEVREQKLKEAQEIAETVLDAEVRIGELMAQVPKAQGFASTIRDNGVANVQTKTSVIERAGFTPKQVERFETLAAHPDLVEQAKAEARENDEIVTRSSVLNMVEQEKKPHIALSTGTNEWYTPSEFIEAAREVMGNIDLDPASSAMANETVKADTYYTVEDDGLSQVWFGNVWMNPPYSTDCLSKFVDKLIYELPHIDQACVLVNNATETEWFWKLISAASCVCFPRRRIQFSMPDGKTGSPLQGQAVIYIGQSWERFAEIFKGKGWCAFPQ